MATMYHGTIKAYADSILANGLKPMPDRAFHVNNIPISAKDGIYLTSDIRLAKQFAHTRSLYSRVEPGEVFDAYEYMWKANTGQPKLDSEDITPVIVKVEIPDDMTKWEIDPDYIGPREAYLCHCSIPPEQVKEIIPMEDTL